MAPPVKAPEKGVAVQAAKDGAVPAVVVATVAPPGEDVKPPGHEIRVQWKEVRGATGAEVSAASVEVAPAVVEESLGTLKVVKSGPLLEVTIGTAPKRVAALALSGLRKGTTQLRSAGDLGAQHLVVTILDASGNWTPPLYAVPELGAKGVIPPSLQGATYVNGLLKFPPVLTQKLRIGLVDELTSTPEAIDVDSVTGSAALVPKDLELVDPGGAQVWSFPGDFPPGAPAALIDLRFPLETALEATLAKPDVSFRLRSAAGGRARVKRNPVHGALVRSFPGVVQTRLEGDPERLALPAPALADETPTGVVAEVTVHYDGMRILEAASDSAPTANGGIGGPVVTDAPVVRELPPAALTGRRVARIGLVGRAPVPAELSVELVDLSTGIPGAAVAPPGVVEFAPSPRIATVWVELPETPPPSVPVGISARATAGRFFWAAGAKGPLVRVAIYDPDPGGRSLRLGGQQILALEKSMLSKERNDVRLPASPPLPVAPFRAQTPVLESDLFLTADVADLTLRYAR